MNKMKLSVKVGGGFGFVFVLLLVVAVFSWQELTTLADGMKEYDRRKIRSMRCRPPPARPSRISPGFPR